MVDSALKLYEIKNEKESSLLRTLSSLNDLLNVKMGNDEIEYYYNLMSYAAVNPNDYLKWRHEPDNSILFSGKIPPRTVEQTETLNNALSSFINDLDSYANFLQDNNYISNQDNIVKLAQELRAGKILSSIGRNLEDTLVHNLGAILSNNEVERMTSTQADRQSVSEAAREYHLMSSHDKKSSKSDHTVNYDPTNDAVNKGTKERPEKDSATKHHLPKK